MSDHKKKLEDFLRGKDSHEGKAAFDKWYKSFPDEKESSHEKTSEEIIKNELARIKGKPVSETETKIREIIPDFSKQHNRNTFLIWKVAAAILVLAIAGAAFYLNKDSAVKPTAIMYAEKVSPKGKRLHFTLADGSRIWLNADSRLRHPEKFDQSIREVYLDGEAYFEVASNSVKPFIIHTATLTTTVLGTSFNVRAYTNEEKHEVAVVTGKVSVDAGADNQNERLTLEPGHKAVLNLRTSDFSKEKFENADLYAAWKDGKLIFENTPISNILESLNRYYNTEIKVSEPDLARCVVTTTFDNLSLKEILDLLSLTLNASYYKDGDVYWIKGKGCK